MPIKKPRKPKENWDFHQHVWKHNSLMGMAKMMERNAGTISASASTTPKTKMIAGQIALLAIELDKALRAERIDP